MRIGGGQHILSPTHMHPFPPVSNFEPHSHKALRVFWTPQGRGTAAAPWSAEDEDHRLPDLLT